MDTLLGMKGEGGKSVTAVVVPGGARESLNGEKHAIKLVLNSRKGFIKMAFSTPIRMDFSHPDRGQKRELIFAKKGGPSCRSPVC